MTATAVHQDADALFDALDDINQQGGHPEMAAMDAVGNPFIASLGDGGDDVTLVYITSDEDGWPTGRTACDECGTRGPSDWTPKWPVTVMVPVRV